MGAISAAVTAGAAGAGPELPAPPGAAQALLWLSAHGGSGVTTLQAATGLGGDHTYLLPVAEAQLISGGYPRTWRVPYVEAWRLGEPPSAANTPKVVARIGQDLVESSRAIDLRGRSQVTLNPNGANQ